MEEVNESTLKDEVQDSSSPVYACFTAPWCRTCYPVCLVANDLIDEYQGRIKFIEINVENYPGLAEDYEIKALPTVLIFNNGQPIHRILSYEEKSVIKDILETITSG